MIEYVAEERERKERLMGNKVEEWNESGDSKKVVLCRVEAVAKAMERI